MLFYLRILGATLTELLLPYYLLGALLRMFLPKSCPSYIALLSAVCMMTMDHYLHVFGNIFDLQRGFDKVMLEAFKPGFEQIRVIVLVTGLVGTLLGAMVFPYALARGGVGTVDKLRKIQMPSKQIQPIAGKPGSG